MAGIQETKIPGTPADIEAIATFMSKSVAGGADTWSTDVGSSSTSILSGWTGEGADAFSTSITKAKTAITTFGDKAAEVATAASALADALRTAQQKMAGVRSTASSGRLTVTGTQIHAPAAPANPTPTPMPSGEEPSDSGVAADEYTNQVQTWNICVGDASAAYADWQAAMEKFAAVWQKSGANMITLLSGLLTAAIEGAALGNAAFRLKSVKVQNGAALESLTKSLGEASKDGKINISKSSFYKLLDETKNVSAAISEAESALAGSADDLAKAAKAGTKLSKGLFVVGLLGTGYGIYDDIANGGESPVQAVTSNVGGMAAGMGASFLAGMGAGAVVGSFIAPPAGTIAGVVVGGVVGTVVGVFTSGVIDHLFEGAADGFVGAVEAGWTEVTDTVSAIGDGIGAIGDGIADVWNSIF